MNQTSRAQGWAICAAAGLAALLFVVGVSNGSYWALAVPVAVVTLFALGLVAWVGYTIATIQVETDAAPEILSTERTSATHSSDSSSDSSSASSSANPSASAEDAA